MTSSQPIITNALSSEMKEQGLTVISPEELARLLPEDTPFAPSSQAQQTTKKGVESVDNLISLSGSNWQPPIIGASTSAPIVGSSADVAQSGQSAGLGALLAPQECEPGDIPSAQLSRDVIQRESDRVEVAVEPRLSPTELNLADMWLQSDFGNWMNLEHLPNGHPKKRALTAISGLPVRLNSLHKKLPKNNMKMLSLLTLLSKSLRPVKKRYVTGLRGELLDEDDEQLLGNTDVMVLPYSPPPPFTIEDIEDVAKQREKEQRAKHRKRLQDESRSRQHPKKPTKTSQDDEENAQDSKGKYEDFDVFDFFERLLSKNAPGSK